MAKSKGITLDNDALDRQLERATRRNPIAAAKTVTGCLLDLSARSIELAPIESGDLRNACTVKLNGSTIYSKQTQVGAAVPALKSLGEVRYSGLPYILRQHEELNYRHDRTDGYRRPDGRTINMVAGGQAKFLEQPFEEMVPNFIARLKKIPAEVLK